jgi:hypothetical protein
MDPRPTAAPFDNFYQLQQDCQYAPPGNRPQHGHWTGGHRDDKQQASRKNSRRENVSDSSSNSSSSSSEGERERNRKKKKGNKKKGAKSSKSRRHLAYSTIELEKNYGSVQHKRKRQVAGQSAK